MKSKQKSTISIYPDTRQLLRTITSKYNISDNDAIKWLINSRNKKIHDKLLDIIRG